MILTLSHKCIFVLLFGIIYISHGQSAEINCHNSALRVSNLSQPVELLQCLEDYAKQQLAPGSAADNLRLEVLQDIFDKEEARLKYDNTYGRGLQRDQIVGTPMLNQYRFRLPSRSRSAPNNQITEGLCFDLSKIGEPSSLTKFFNNIRTNSTSESLKNKYLVLFAKKMMRQIDEVAKFLANFHAITLGGESSLLFHPRQIKFCDQNRFSYFSEHGIDRRMIYYDKSLNIGINNPSNPSKIKVITAKELMALWNDGDQIRVVPKKYNYDLKKQSITELVEDPPKYKLSRATLWV